MWDRTRLIVYITSGLTGLAALLAFFGWATFDQATGLVDLAPFNIYAAAPFIATVVSSILAAVALLFKWGKK